MEKLKVIFKKSGKEIVAFFPELRANYGNIVSYIHVGQHGEASYYFYSGLKNATEDEYATLLEELKRIYDGCVLVVKKRVCYNDLTEAWR